VARSFDTLYRQSIAKLLGGFMTPWVCHT